MANDVIEEPALSADHKEHIDGLVARLRQLLDQEMSALINLREAERELFMREAAYSDVKKEQHRLQLEVAEELDDPIVREYWNHRLAQFPRVIR